MRELGGAFVAGVLFGILTWLVFIGPETDKPVYAEPELIVSPVRVKAEKLTDDN